MWLLLLIGLGLILLLLSGRGKSSSGSFDAQLSQRNKDWADFIAEYRSKVHTKAEKALVERMLADIAAKGLPVPPASAGHSSHTLAVGEISLAAAETSFASEQTTTAGERLPEPPRHTEVKVQMDNVSMLLYFGAFLFVASVGLFVAFGDISGGLRTFAVLLVSLSMYGSGIWLHQNRKKLQQAGLAFVGIGMASAPFVGLAAYNYLFAESNAAGVWFATSLLCLVMYMHALATIRKPLISYMLIFTFLSLFESGVSITASPIYYFGWGMALVGIILSFIGQWKGYWPELQESSRQSANVFLPLALLASLTMVSSQGYGQLGVSLLLAAAFYGLGTFSNDGDEREVDAVVTQLSTLGGVGMLTYAATGSWETVSWILVVMSLLQAVGLLFFSTRSVIWQNFASVLLVTRLVGLGVAAPFPSALLAVALSLPVMGAIVWLIQKRADAYVYTMLAVLALPLIIGQGVMEKHLAAGPQVALILAALAVQLCAYLWHRRKNDQEWLNVARYTYLVSGVIVVIASLFTTPLFCLAICTAVVLSLLLLAEYDKLSDWSIVGGIVLLVPIFRAIEDEKVFLTSIVVALAFNVLMALRHRHELNRWLSTGIWLVLPLGIGGGALGFEWNALGYAWAYVVAMIVLVISRAIARGVLFVSGKVPLASYAKNASQSYVVGYGFAAFVAVMLSFLSDHSQVHTTLIFVILALVTYVLAKFIEKRADMLVLLPILGQAVLWSALRPASDATTTLTACLLASTAIAVIGYFILMNPDDARTHPMQQGSLLMVFLVPVSAIFSEGTIIWPMPFGLLVASGLVYHHIRETNQANREWVGALALAAVMWFMSIWGVHAVQAYTHVLVALFAFYAYWRTTRGETEQADQYLMAMLVTATIPLALQAMSSTSGGVYGWWLLLEEVAFMLLGMTIGKRFVTRWGLYASLGAVLYQLRSLGWAALAVLAMFLIGLAVYRLQKLAPKE